MQEVQQAVLGGGGGVVGYKSGLLNSPLRQLNVSSEVHEADLRGGTAPNEANTWELQLQRKHQAAQKQHPTIPTHPAVSSHTATTTSTSSSAVTRTRQKAKGEAKSKE